MGKFITVVSGHKECLIGYDATITGLPAIATVIALRHAIKQTGCSPTLQSMEGKHHYEHLAESDWSRPIGYVENQEGNIHLSYSYFDGEHVFAEEIIDYREAFSKEDRTLLDRISDENYEGNHLPLSTLWTLLDAKPKEDKLIKTLLCGQLLEQYPDLRLTRQLVENGYPTLYSIYFILLDFIHRHSLKLHQPKPKERETKKIKKEGKVVFVHHGKHTDPNYLDYGFKHHPEAQFLINYWDNGVLQVKSHGISNPVQNVLENTYEALMNTYEKKFSKTIIPLSTIKWVLEYEGDLLINLSFETLLHQKPHLFYGSRNHTLSVLTNKEQFLTPCEMLTDEQWKQLDGLGISLWDLFKLTSVILTNAIMVVAFIFYGKPARPGKTAPLFPTEKAVKLSTVFRRKWSHLINNYL